MKRDYSTAFDRRVAASMQKRARRRRLARTMTIYRMPPQTRAGYSSVARTRGAAVTGEMKYFTTFLDQKAFAISNTWTGCEMDPATLNTLFVPQVGAALDQRIGRKVHVHKIKIRGEIGIAAQSAQTLADSGGLQRVVLYMDKQTNATQATSQSVMFGGAVSSPVAQCAFQLTDNFGRFRVLKDKSFRLDNPNLGGTPPAMVQNGLHVPFKMNVRFRTPITVNFNATNGGTVADIVDNSFHVIAHATSTTLAPLLTYQCRVCYKE